MTFQNDTKSLTLTVSAYEFPDRDGKGEDFDFDANWLVLHGEYREGRSLRTFDNSCLLTTELQELIAALKLMIGGVRDSFQSEFTDPYFELSIEALDLTRFMVYASFSMLVAENEWKNFDVESVVDTDGLKKLLDEAERESKNFPVKE